METVSGKGAQFVTGDAIEFFEKGERLQVICKIAGDL